jgi:hypothetical protein
MHRQSVDSGQRVGLRPAIRVAALYAVLFLLMGYPVSLNPGSMALPADPDTDLFMWTFAWNTHALLNQPLSWFDANIYHPHRHTLAFSENLLGNTIFAAPIIWATGNHVLALNTVAFASVVLCGVGAWLLARRLGAGPHAAILAGLIFAYSPARFLRFGQLHLTTIQWIPFSLAFLHSYLDTGRKRDLRLAVAFFTLQVLSSGHGATFLAVAILCIVAYRVMLGEPLAIGRRVRDFGVTGLLLLVPVGLVLLPYRYVQTEMGLRRTLDADWGAAPESFVASPSIFHLWLLSFFPDAQVAERATAWLFPGFLPIALALAAMIASRWSAAPFAWRPVTARLLEVVLVASLLVSLWSALFGPMRLRLGEMVLFTARDPVRAWIVLVVSLALRVAMERPLSSPWGRLRAWGARLRDRALGARTSAVACYGVLLLLTLLFAAGPPLGIWPWIYHLPGFNFIRVPSRFVLLGVLALAILAAFGFDRMTRGWPNRRRTLAATALGAVMLLEFLTIPLPAVAPLRVQIPAADRWLDAEPKPFVVAEVPTNTNERLQSTYMLHSMAHWQKTVNGHSGVRTPLHYALYDYLQSFPDDESLDALAKVGVTYVVVHMGLYWPEERPGVEAGLERYADRLELMYRDREDRVYRLRGQAGTPRAELQDPDGGP